MTAEQLVQSFDNGADADRLAAAQALASMEASAIGPATLALVRGASDELVAEWCVAALEEMGAPPEELVSGLAELVKAAARDEAKSDSAYWGATLLGRLGARGAPAVETLAEVAKSAAALAARERAVWALGKIGPDAANALPVLRSLADADLPRLARLAKQAVEAIGG